MDWFGYLWGSCFAIGFCGLFFVGRGCLLVYLFMSHRCLGFGFSADLWFKVALWVVVVG